MIKSVLKQYPNCTFQKMVYSVDYDDQKDVAKTYKIQIIKNDIKTNLKFSSTNNLDNPITMSMDN